jgi:Protein of unknown function (DUF1579)
VADDLHGYRDGTREKHGRDFARVLRVRVVNMATTNFSDRLWSVSPSLSVIALVVLTGVTQSMLAAQGQPPPFVFRGEPGPEHHRLDALAGEWRAEGKWMIAGGTPEKPVRTDNLRTVRTWVADGRFLQDVTKGTLGGKTYWRMGLLGFSTMDRRYEWVTVDALNSMLMIYQGEPRNDALNMTGVFTDQGLLGEATVGKQIGQRTQIIIESPDRHIIRLYMKPPGRSEFLASEMVFTRVH